MKVYIVWEDYGMYESPGLYNIYLLREKAQKFIDENPSQYNYWIEEIEVIE